MPDAQTSFRSTYSTAASVRATKLSGTDGGPQVWSLSVLNAGGTVLGTARPVSFIGSFVPHGVVAAGYPLLDCEVVAAGAWTASGADFVTSAYSQRA